MVDRIINRLRRIHPQRYINALLVLIGLGADLIALGTYFGAVHTPVTGSNFYVNSREFLSWVLIAWVYSFGLFNAYIRRRWKRLFSNKKANNSVFNIFALPASEFFSDPRASLRNFQRDFSFVYVVMFVFVYLFGRAVTATNNAVGITPSPWGDLVLTTTITVPITFFMMIITSMFDFAMSMFVGDQHPENLP